VAFDSFADFVQMGNHGFYVWLAYGITFVVLVWLAVHALTGHARVRRELAAQRRRHRHAGALSEPDASVDASVHAEVGELKS